MSGPYPQQGYPQQPAQGGWGGQVGGGPSGPYGRSNYPAGWQQQQQHDQPAWNAGPPPEPTPPPRKRNTGQLITVIVAALVIIGGVATGIVLLDKHHAQPQATQGSTTPTATTQQQQASNQPGASNASGSTTLTVSAGQCVTATTSTGSSSYSVTKAARCGTTASDFVLNKTVSAVSGCAAQQYVVITGPNGSVYCFTVDARAGDCVDSNYLKVACGAKAVFTVLKTEAGPGGDTSCRDVSGAKRWVPAGYPAVVACIGSPGGG
jgi:hypothetical protein